MMSEKKEGMDPSSGKDQSISVGNIRTGKREVVDGGTGGGNSTCETFVGQGIRKREMKCK